MNKNTQNIIGTDTNVDGSVSKLSVPLECYYQIVTFSKHVFEGLISNTKVDVT